MAMEACNTLVEAVLTQLPPYLHIYKQHNHDVGPVHEWRDESAQASSDAGATYAR